MSPFRGRGFGRSISFGSNSKYGAKKIENQFGTFDSKLEYNRYLFLLKLEESGVIYNLRRQVEYLLIPAQTITIERTGKRGQPLKPETKVVELKCCYKADFVYMFNNLEIIEDTKGFKTPEYIIKRKLMRLHGNPITEVTKATQPINL